MTANIHLDHFFLDILLARFIYIDSQRCISSYLFGLSQALP